MSVVADVLGPLDPRMAVVYIAGPYRARTRWEVYGNIRRAEEVGLLVAQMGMVPLIPHSLFGNFDGERSDAFWLDATAELLKRCDAIFLIQGWQRSEGSRSEHSIAKRMGLPIFDAHDGARALQDLATWYDRRRIKSPLTMNAPIMSTDVESRVLPEDKPSI